MITLGPIENNGHDETRFYIPLPGGWEVQTQGRGSSFRICDTKSGDRLLIPPSPYLHELLERMAREIHAAVSPAIDALELIGKGGCSNFWQGHCEASGRVRGAQFGADAWCDACIANDALGRAREIVKL